MTEKNKIIIANQLKTTTENQFVEISIVFYEGGFDYNSLTESNRGYYLVIVPVLIDKLSTKGVYIRNYNNFTGARCLIEATVRYSRRRIKHFVDNYEKIPKYYELLVHVTQTNNIELK